MKSLVSLLVSKNALPALGGCGGVETLGCGGVGTWGFGFAFVCFSTEAWISTSSFSTSSFSMSSFSASSFSTSSPFCPPAKISYLTVGYFVRRVWSLNGRCRGYSCRFRKLHPLDSRSLANQNMIAGCSQLPSFSCACCATVSSRDGGLKPKSWCCGINSTFCSSALHVGYI